MNKGRDLRKPGRRIRIATKGDDDDVLLNLSQFADQLVLSEREVIALAVAILTILLVVLVQSTYKYNKVCVSGFPKSLFPQGRKLVGTDFVNMIVESTARVVTLSIGNARSTPLLQSL